jgi:hypothetical protein
MSKEILRPQKAQPVPVPLAHIIGEIDHMGKVWTPAHPARWAPVPNGFWLAEATPNKLNLWPVTEAQLLALALAPVQSDEVGHNDWGFPIKAQPAQQEPIDLVRAIEYADARWSGVDVPIEWARHFAEGIRRTEAAHGIKEKTT